MDSKDSFIESSENFSSKKARYVNVQRKVGMVLIISFIATVIAFLKRDLFVNYQHYPGYSKLYQPEFAKLKKWNNFFSSYSKNEIVQGRKMLDSHGLLNKGSDSALLMNITNWLARTLSKCSRGQPSESFDKLPMIEKLTAASRSESPIWCGTYTHFVHFFCSIAGITTRAAEAQVVGDVHSIAECYIAEKGEWAVVDLTYNICLPADSSGHLMNVADVYAMNSVSPKQINAYIFDQNAGTGEFLRRSISSEVWLHYLNRNSHLIYYHSFNPSTLYEPLSKIRRYLLGEVWFDSYSLNPKSNLLFFIRTLFFYTMLVSAVAFAGLFFYNNSISAPQKKDRKYKRQPRG